MKPIVIPAAATILAALLGTAVVAQSTTPPPPAGQPMPAMKGRMWLKADTNNDGRVSRDEFLRKASERFAKIDANRDGYIDQAEHQAMREQHRAKRNEWRAKHGRPPLPPMGATPPAPPAR